MRWVTTPRSPHYPPTPPDPSGHSRYTVIASVISGVATVLAALIGAFVLLPTASDGKSQAAPAVSPSPVPPLSPSATPTPTPSPVPTHPALLPEPTQPPTPALTPAGLPSELSGTWVGTATEVDTDSTDTYRVTLELHAGRAVGGEAGRVDYEWPGTNKCHGVVTLTAVEPDTAAVTLGEYIETGMCVKGGRITLTPSAGGTLDFAYQGFKRDGSGQGVTASLAKVRY